jgi:Na+-translocating ferredoxin:NAD+ oxidoreductase RNF subunit RnfB
MSHVTAKKAYQSLEQRLNRFPQGAPPSESLYKILNLLFSEQEAALVSQLPVKPFTANTAAGVWKMTEPEAEKLLQQMAGKALLLDMETNGVRRYVLPPPMAGFFEFSMMRTRQDLDQKLLAELFYQYLNVEEEFVRDVFVGSETPIVRTYVHEPALNQDHLVNILDYEKASHIIESAAHIGISMCYCRHKMEHLGKNCDASMDICMTFNNTADSLIRHGHARRVDTAECMDLLQQAYHENLVQCGENVQNQPSFICNCCGCCCEALLAAKKFGMLHPVQTTRYLPHINNEMCISCGKCIERCPVDAVQYRTTATESIDGSPTGKRIPEILEEICLGCGLCVRACPNKSMSLRERDETIITPVNSAHRAVMMAIEKGMLQELIFDNKALESHRAMAAVLGVIMKLPPVKQVMASRQMKSIYLGRLLNRS